MKLVKKRFEDALISGLRRLPLVSFYAGTRGWYFVVSWCHRITGILAVLMVLIHMDRFGSAPDSGKFFLVTFFQWVLSIPVIFHAFNGARLIQYECWGRRDDENMLRWVFGLLLVFVSLLALFMIVGGQRVSPFFYWVLMIAGALVAGYAVGAKIWNTKHSVSWKLQRVSGAFLLVMIPAYILFIPLHPAFSRFLKGVYVLLLLATLYHGGYGVWSVVSDYVSSRSLQKILIGAATLLFLVLFWIGVRVIVRA
jgi:succinate dehydrogenase hydrophobic anchor subunit